jgi:flavin reductase (DIM6/NTAB) family NADH-FMN oxidoreductase RutF
LRVLGRFCVNVLAEGQDDLSQNFARSGVDKFAGVHWMPSRRGNPVLDDVVAWIEAELWAEYDGGDHTIVAARVLDLDAAPHRRPLLYHRGSYGLLDNRGDAS